MNVEALKEHFDSILELSVLYNETIKFKDDVAVETESAYKLVLENLKWKLTQKMGKLYYAFTGMSGFVMDELTL